MISFTLSLLLLFGALASGTFATAFAFAPKTHPITHTFISTSSDASASSQLRRSRVTIPPSRYSSPWSLYAKKDKYGNTKKSQHEILLELESKFDYEGRISSKVTSTSNSIDENDDEEETSDDDQASSSSSSNSNPHRCALITILGMPNMGKSTLLNALLSDDLAM